MTVDKEKALPFGNSLVILLWTFDDEVTEQHIHAVVSAWTGIDDHPYAAFCIIRVLRLCQNLIVQEQGKGVAVANAFNVIYVVLINRVGIQRAFCQWSGVPIRI